MAQIFQSQIESYLNETVAAPVTGITAVMLSDWFDQGVKAVVRMLPAPVKEQLATASSPFAPSTGILLDQALVVSVFRAGNECRYIPQQQKNKAATQTSLYAATVNMPVWYAESGKVYALPADTANIAEVWTYSIPTGQMAAMSIGGGYPAEIEDLPVFWAVAQAKHHQSAYYQQLAQAYMQTNGVSVMTRLMNDDIELAGGSLQAAVNAVQEATKATEDALLFQQKFHENLALYLNGYQRHESA